MNMEKIKLLDHGYLQVIESWGSDRRIIESARMSTNKGFIGWSEDLCCEFCGLIKSEFDLQLARDGHNAWTCLESHESNGPKVHKFPTGDEKLLRFLYSHKHSTPFEMAGLIIEVQAPIFVFREWHRHRTQSYNEMSARYTPLPDLNYIPTIERLMLNSKANKQAGTIKDSETLTERAAAEYQKLLQLNYDQDELLYQHALKTGVPKELARVHLPVGRYSRMRASANLRNWLLFLVLRMAENAQYEIRCYANALHDLLVDIFPKTMQLFDEDI